MSGIFGCYFFGESQIDLSVIADSMLKPLLVDAEYESETFIVDGRILLGTVDTNKENKTYIDKNDEGGIITVFSGFFHNRNELSRLEGLKNGIREEGKVLSSLYQKDGTDSFYKFSGIFSFALFNTKTKHIAFGCDRNGFEYVYYYVDDEKLLFGSRINSIIEAIENSLEFDFHSICDIHNFHSIFDCKTIYKKIKLLPPAGICSIRNSTIKIRRYWEFPVNIKLFDKSEPDLVEDSKRLITESVEQCVDQADEAGIMLSGGLDSRLLAAVLSEKMPRAKALSFQWGHLKSKENELAKKIADTLGLPFQFYGSPIIDILDYVKDNVTLSDGTWGFHELVPIFKDLRKEQPGLILLNGFLMDTLFRSGWAFFPDREESLLSSDGIIDRFGLLKDYLARIVFKKDYCRLLRIKREETVKNAIEKQPLERPAEVSLRFYFHNRARRTILSQFNILRQFLPMRFPAVSNVLFDFAIKLPYSLRSNTQFYRKLIYDWFPEIGKIPWDRSGKPLSKEKSNLKCSYHNLQSKFYYALQRLSRGNIDFINRAGGFDYNFRRNKKFRSRVIECLSDSAALMRDYYDNAGIEKLAKYVLSGRDAGNLFKSLLSVEMMHRVYKK